MKPIYPFALLGALLAVGAANAATTTPVGYTTTTIYGAFNASSPKNNVIAPNLQNQPSWTGVVGSISGDTLTLTSATLTAGQFNHISDSFSLGTVYAYYIETSDGYWAQIVSNDATSVTIEAGAASNFSAGESVTIRRHITISDYFGSTNQTGLASSPSGDANEADNIILIDEVNGGTLTIFASDVLEGTWITDGFEDAASIPIYPDQGVQVLRREVSNLSIVQTGEVDTNGRQIQVSTGVQIRPIVLPADTTLADLDIYSGNTATGLAGSGNADLNEADGLSVLVDGSPLVYFYSTIDLDGSGPGWYDDSFSFAGDTILPAGAALILNRNNPDNSSPFIWVNPAPTIAP